MIIQTNTITNIEINTLQDLRKLKFFIDNNKLKINKAQIARNLNVDSWTVSKYLNGYEKTKFRNKSYSMDDYYEIIK